MENNKNRPDHKISNFDEKIRAKSGMTLKLKSKSQSFAIIDIAIINT